MSYKTVHVPVVIAGGGPSGAATALSLRYRGIDCLVIEARPQPVFRSGETIPPSSVPLLRKLQIDGLLEHTAHAQCHGNRSVWGQAEPYDKAFLQNTHTYGWHIDRPFFEQQLKDTAIAAGARWLSGTRVMHCEQTRKGWEVTIRNEDGGQEILVPCNFMVDASGRASRIGKLLGIQRKRADYLVGVSVCFTMADTSYPLYTFVEAVKSGWWYAAPLTGGRVVTTYFTDADLLPPNMMDINTYKQALNDANLIGNTLNIATAKQYTQPTTTTASTSWLLQRHTDKWLAVGDAAIAYDPISSYGITSALESGYYAGHAIADTLAGKKDALAAYDWILNNAYVAYKEMYDHQYSLEPRWAEDEFWKRRQGGM